MNQIISDRPPVQTQDSPSPMLAAALSYAARGWHVFPVAQGKKAPPTTEHGCYDGTTDPTTILRWWGDHPYANIGIATGDKSGLLVVDLDIYKEPEALPSFQAQHGTHKTYTVKTPRGGLHLYFSLRPRQKARCTNEEKGMCIKGTGGYVVAPPSNTNDGRYAVSDARSPAKTPASLCGPAPARQTRNSSSRPSAPPRVALRDATRVTLTALLKQLAPYLELVAQGDTAILATTGYGLRNDIVHNQGSKNWGQSYLMLQLLFLMGGCLTLAYISWPKKSVKGTHRSLAVLNIKFKFKVIDFAKVHQAARPLP